MAMKKYIILLVFLLGAFHSSSYAYSFTDFDQFQNTFTKDELAQRIHQWLQKDVEIANYFELTDQTFSLFATPQEKIAHQPEFVLKLTSAPKFKCLPSDNNLDGLRIAIDPGHFGGPLAMLEQRWIAMNLTRPGSPTEEIRFDEGTLTLLTAKVLKSLLEQAGAKVFLTKENNGQGVYEKDFWTWIKETKPTQALSLPDIFRQSFNPLDLRARAQKINAFHPDLTIIIHYNAHNDRSPLTQENIPSKYNYNMIFVGGGFCKGELKDPESRYEFLRLLLTEDEPQSIALSHEILKQFTSQLEVPPIDDSLQVKYLTNASVKIEDGIYARNLTLTRLVHGPICYGETFCQDNVQESLRLNAKDLTIDHVSGPKRIEQVAKAYYDGIVEYLKKKKLTTWHKNCTELDISES